MQGGKNSSSIKVTSKREGKSIHHGLIPPIEREGAVRAQSSFPIHNIASYSLPLMASPADGCMMDW